MTEDVGKDERSGKSERYGEDNCQRQDVALVLCGEDEVHEDETQGEDDARGVARLLL